LLIYGENGSGKSSIYWALYTLLEAVYKSDSEQNKYFDPVGNAESLLNLYTPTPTDSFIGLELADGKTYRIALNDFSIRAEANSDATARASDFLNYRFMFRLIDFRHREEIDLFRLFEKEVFPYIKTRSKFTLIHTPKDSFDFNEIWDDLKKGARRPTVFEGPTPSPTPTPTTTINYNQLQREYADLLRSFVSEVNLLAQEINVEGNGILQQVFGYQSIRFEITCIQKFGSVGGGGELAGRESDYPEGFPKIKLLIPEYEGLQNVVKKPQSFLNEAKLTAIGIAIRLAILSRRLDYADGADFQLLVLDDLLISLDMSNRRKVLDLLLNRYAQDFQLIVLTHDRAFYEKTKRQIVTAGQEGEWLHFEMYEDTRTTPSKPFIKKSESFIDNAIKHFHEFEFPAAANSLRKACEELLYELLPPHQIYTKEMSKIWQLDNLLAKAETYYKSFPISYQPILEIREYVKTLMNPLSHSDLESPVYRQELNDVTLPSFF
jgi:energy-coupling factor transporter ATP-binding protein EcfA2